MLEKTVEAALVKRVKELGGIAYKWTSPGRTGVPDRIVMLPGKGIVFVELKRPGGQATVRQLREHETIRGFGFEVRIIDSLEEARAFTL